MTDRHPMRLADLIEGLPLALARGAATTLVSAIVEDSRAVEPGALFVARTGTHTDGRAFIEDAIARGAVAVLTVRAVDVEAPGVAHLVSDQVERSAALLAERLHEAPSTALTTIGITGTNGKTTVAWLVHQLLNRAGIRCGLIGTVHVDDGGTIEPSELTTPPAMVLSRTLRRMVRNGCHACAMEVSSHALAQYRTSGLRFAGSVFTNVSGDHMDYHGSMDAYVATKARLFADLPADGWAVVNADDEAAAAMIEASRAPVLTTSLTDVCADCHAEVGVMTMQATQTRLHGPWGLIEIDLSLVGRHNVANALQAAAVAHAVGVGRDDLADGLARCVAPPGRLEPVRVIDDEVTVLVDYAHTDDALDNVLRAVAPIARISGRLWVVFGCGGDRDATSALRMAQVACRWGDEVVVTSDNPRTEDPQVILDDVVAGIPAAQREATAVFVDRAEAIAHAIIGAAPGDVVVIAGKGHEDYQIIGTSRRPFDDRTVAAEALQRRRMETTA